MEKYYEKKIWNYLDSEIAKGKGEVKEFWSGIVHYLFFLLEKKKYEDIDNIIPHYIDFEKLCRIQIPEMIR